MAVVATFLRDGAPVSAAKSFSSVYGEAVDAYATWVCVASFARRWSTDLRQSSFVCPGALLWFGARDDDTIQAGLLPPAHALRLFRHHPLQLSAVDGYPLLDICREVLARVRESCEVLPDSRRPNRIIVLAHASPTHAAIGLLSRSELLQKLRVLAETEPDHCAASRISVCPSNSPLEHAHVTVMEDAMDWLLASGAPSVHPTTEVRSMSTPQWAALLGVLYDPHHRAKRTSPVQCMATRPFVWDAGSAQDLASPKRPKAWCEVCVPPSSTSPVETPWRYGVIMQPAATERRTSEDGIITGPVQPCSQSFRLYLHADIGDVHFARKAIMGSPIPVEQYDDVLPTDGAVLLSVGWVEGVPFHDLDIILSILRQLGVLCDEPTDGTTQAPKSQAACKSCFPWPIPHVSHRIPTGVVARRTPVENPSMQVEEKPLDKDEGGDDAFRGAQRALEWFCEHMVVNDRGLSLPMDVWQACQASMSPSAVACAWCGRERAKLLRCGGCKAAHYCSKQHQALDWKGPHRGECPRWKSALEAYEKLVVPSLSQRNTVEGTRAGDDARSTAWTIITMLRTISPSMLTRARQSDVFVAHVVMEDLDGPFFDQVLREMSGRSWTQSVEGVLSAWHRSQLRVVVCSPMLHASHRNVVLRITSGDSAPPESVPGTGVMGDDWHNGGAEHVTAGSPVVLVRLVNEKYHNYFLALNNDAPKATRHDLLPDALFVLGDGEGQGLTFFSAVAEVIGDNLLGVVPVACSDSSLIAAHRTWTAIQQRRSGHGTSIALDSALIEPVMNLDAFADETPRRGATSMPKPPVPLHRNLYITSMPAVDV